MCTEYTTTESTKEDNQVIEAARRSTHILKYVWSDEEIVQWRVFQDRTSTSTSYGPLVATFGTTDSVIPNNSSIGSTIKKRESLKVSAM